MNDLQHLVAGRRYQRPQNSTRTHVERCLAELSETATRHRHRHRPCTFGFLASVPLRHNSGAAVNRITNSRSLTGILPGLPLPYTAGAGAVH